MLLPSIVKVSRTRSCSLPDKEEDVEVTRQFLAVNKKVINRGDSFRRRERPNMKTSSTEGQISSLAGQNIATLGLQDGATKWLYYIPEATHPPGHLPTHPPPNLKIPVLV